MTSQDFLDDLWGSPEEAPAKSSTFNSVKLATYFEHKLQSSKWYTGFGIVNRKALAGSFARWKQTGLTSDQAYAMVDAYMDNASLRSNVPGWQDFINRRDMIIQHLNKHLHPEVDKWSELEEDYDEDAAMKAYLERKRKRDS